MREGLKCSCERDLGVFSRGEKEIRGVGGSRRAALKGCCKEESQKQGGFMGPVVEMREKLSGAKYQN